MRGLVDRKDVVLHPFLTDCFGRAAKGGYQASA
jgi:hypothetical protein